MNKEEYFWSVVDRLRKTEHKFTTYPTDEQYFNALLNKSRTVGGGLYNESNDERNKNE